MMKFLPWNWMITLIVHCHTSMWFPSSSNNHVDGQLLLWVTINENENTAINVYYYYVVKLQTQWNKTNHTMVLADWKHQNEPQERIIKILGEMKFADVKPENDKWIKLNTIYITFDIPFDFFQYDWRRKTVNGQNNTLDFWSFFLQTKHTIMLLKSSETR